MNQNRLSLLARYADGLGAKATLLTYTTYAARERRDMLKDARTLARVIAHLCDLELADMDTGQGA